MKKIYFTFFFCAFLNFVFGQEYKMKVSSVTSLQKAQSGNEVTRTIDDNMTTMYHSTYGVVGIPDQLDFSFSPRVKSIKSLIYYPRATGSNGVWTNVDVYYSTQADPGNFIKLNDAPLVWALNNTSKRYDFPAAVQNPAVIRVKVNSGAGNFSSCAEMEFYSSEQGMPVSTECNLATSEFDSLKDIAVKPSISGSSASNFQSGQNIEKSFDGDTSTLYHSSWTATTFPIELIYNFDGVTAMDYLRYTSRQDGGINGMFGNIKISYNTISDPTYIPLKTMDFAQGSGVKRVEFGSTITPLNIKIEVLDGRGNFASCAEMEFFRNNPNGFNLSLYSNLFNDTLFSELKSGVTQQDIDAVASPFIKALAQCLFNNTYNKKYRVQTYMPYKTISSINKGYKIGDYNQFEGTLGIVFQQNTTAVIFAKNITESHPVSLRIKDFAAEGSASVDRSYDLKNGINFIPITNNGLGYISYFTDDPNAVPVSVNVTAGIVNGIYKKGTSSTEWKEILANDVYSKVDLEGIYTKLVFTKSALKTYHSDDVQPLIDKYDIIAKSERELMGFFKYNKNFKNRQFIYTENSGGWNAGGLGVHLDLSWGIANSASATGMDFWGVAHELGHVNQVRPGVKWIGTTEVTNNIYTAWAAYNLYTPTKPTTLETHVGEKTSFPSIAGNRYGEMIMNSMVKGNNIMWHFLDSSTASYEKHFRGVIPFWQLELYYQLAGASKGASTLTFDKDMTDEVPATAKTSVSSKSNSTEVDYAHWYAYVVDKTIATDETQISDGQLSLNFVKNVCDAVQEDLTDFFTNAGFLKPANGFITDYSLNKPFLVTQEMIDETKAYIASKGYQKPVSPVINYISANSVSVFKNKLAMTGVTGTGAELITNTNGQFIKVTNSQWQNAVAFETLGANDELVSASIVGTGDTTLANTFVDFPSNAVKVYAVGYDGQKILVYPSSALSSSDVKVNDIFTVYPNPIKNGGKLTIKLKDAKGNLSAALYDMSGRVIVKSNGSLEKIKEQINAELGSAKTGIYILTVNDGEKKYQSKIIKQ